MSFDQYTTQPPNRLTGGAMQFSPANSKLSKLYKHDEVQRHLQGRKIYSLDLLSGHTCQFAKLCKSMAILTESGLRIEDGEHTEFRCYSASSEARLESTYNRRAYNTDLLRSCTTEKQMVDLIESSLPFDAGIVRPHSAGDFFSIKYFRAWLKVFANHPEIIFYFYTKCNPYLVKYWNNIEMLPNVSYTASRGGTRDDLIQIHGLREAVVVADEAEAESMGLECDYDDSHACFPWLQEQSFALVIHGTQPAIK
tara:strand:- start:2044 stop:2802 length:759 start_codon:yes stop_codon:yes gene_type:complete